MPHNLAARTLVGTTLLALVGGMSSAMAQQSDDICSQRAYEMGLKYQQQSAEVRALQMQGFAIATDRLKSILDGSGENRSLAIVTDLDETVLDNSPLLVRDMRACHDYTTWDTWSQWEQDGKPALTPGSKAFLDFADQNDVAIYYISNRFQENEGATIQTLKDLGLPQVTEDSVKLYGPTKEERRSEAGQDHEIVLLLGDTLADFANAFDDATLDKQREEVSANADHFGADWIVFPNAAYGDWDKTKLDAWDAEMKTSD